MAGYDGMVIRFEGPPAMRAEWEAQKLFEFVWEPSGSLPARKRAVT